jgi:EpsI family protein
MRSGGLRAFSPAFVLLLGCVLLYQGTRDQAIVPLAGRLDGILSRVDGYQVQDQHVSDDERRVAGMSDYVARMYLRPDSSVAFTTYVGYYERQTQGKTIHSPRNCLPGAGWEIVKSGTATVTAASGPHVVNHYLLKNGPIQAVVYYWYQGRGRVVANEYRVKLNLLRDAAFKGHTEEALVRIVVPIEAKVDPAQAYARADRLGAQIAPRLMDEVEQVMPGVGADRVVAVAAAGGAH